MQVKYTYSVAVYCYDTGASVTCQTSLLQPNGRRPDPLPERFGRFPSLPEEEKVSGEQKRKKRTHY